MTAVLLSTGHDEGIGKIKREDSFRFRTNLWPFRMSSRAELTKMNPALQRRQNDVMICAECFCAKGDTNTVRWSCQNPKCYFYFSASSRHAGSVGEIGGLPKTLANEPIFSRERSRDRRRDPPNSSSDILLSSLQKESVWGYHPETTHLQSQNSLCVEQKSRSLSISELHRYNPSQDKTRFLRTRIMSVPGPVCIESLDQDSDLIEDAFISSPLPDFGEDSTSIGEERRLNTPDTDSGIGSPFGRSSNFLDWMSTTKSAGQTLSSSPFDMGALRTELTSCNTAKPTTSALLDLGSNGRGSPTQWNLRKKFFSLHTETYSRKVFIGGLPPDIDEDEIRVFFSKFGSLTVDWPHKTHSKSCVPPKDGMSRSTVSKLPWMANRPTDEKDLHLKARSKTVIVSVFACYAFLLFKEETSVHKLLMFCISEGDKFFIYIHLGSLSRKKVQVRPWLIADSQYVVDHTQSLDSRKAVFVGGVPRPLKASELAVVMNEKYGNIAYVAIECDNDLKYPKGAACVVFSSHASYFAAVSARFMQLNYASLDKKIELKPYVLDGQMCDECHGVQCSGKPAPFFCSSVTCLQYFCEYCWATVHSLPGRQNHRPLMKDIGAERARCY